eukprot:gene1145-1310_t
MVASAADYTWDITQSCTVAPGCDFSDGSHWVNGTAPSTNSDTATIQYPGSTVNPQLISISQAVTLYQLTVSGNVKLALADTVNIVVTDFVQLNSTQLNAKYTSNINVGGTFTMTQGSGIDIRMGSSITIQDTFSIDTSSSFVQYNTSSINIEATATFNNIPFINDQATLSVGLTSLTPVIFVLGIAAPTTGAITLGWTTIKAKADFQTVLLMSDAVVTCASSSYVTVNEALSGPAGSSLFVANGGHFTANEVSRVSIDILQTEPQSVTQFNGVSDIIRIRSVNAKGPVLFDSVNNATMGMDDGTQGVNFALLQTSGLTTINVQDALIQYLSVAKPPTSQVTGTSLTFSGNLSAISLGNGNFPLNSLLLIVSEGGSLAIDGTLNFTGTPGIYVYGTAYINADIIMPENSRGFLVYGSDAQLYTTSVTIDAAIQVEQGIFGPSNTNIIGDFYQSQGAILTLFRENGTNLFISGDFNQNENTVTKLIDDLFPHSDPLINVQGQIVVAGSIEADLSTTQLTPNDPYFIMSSKVGITGTFNSTKVVFQQGTINTYDAAFEITDPDHFLTLTIYDRPPAGKHAKMAGWKIFLIILSIVVALVGGAYGFHRYKRNSGYLRI